MNIRTVAPEDNGSNADSSELAVVKLDDDHLSELITLRRSLHEYPELRFAEVATSQALLHRLKPFGNVRSGVAGTGIVVQIEGDEDGPTVLLRADMDAYPVQDTKSVAYASKNAGVTHACGHDVHMAVLTGVLERLAQNPPQRGSVHALFQPAEEIPFGEKSGAEAVLISGALPSPTYDAVLGLHCWPDLDAGHIGIDAKIAMAAKDAFSIEIRGLGAHAATPARGRDAVLATSALVQGLHGAIARRHDPQEAVAFNVGTFVGGSSQSVVPSHAVVTGTLRTLDEGVRFRLKAVVDRVARGVAEEYDVAAAVTWANQMAAVENDSDLVRLARGVLPAVVDVVELPLPPMTSDDFAVLGEKGPLLYLKLGVRKPGNDDSAALHSSSFDVDERCIETGVIALETLVRAALERAPRKRNEGPNA